MNNAITQIVGALKVVAEKLGQGAEALYRAYYEQTILIGVEKIVTALIVLTLVGLGAWFGYKKVFQLFHAIDTWEVKEAKFSLGDEQTYLAAAKVGLKAGIIIIAAILVTNGFGLVINSYSSLLTGVNYVINPNYQTIQTILTQVTGRR